MSNCLNPAHSERKVYSRGLCHTCYATARKGVKGGSLTWEWLEEKGRSLPLRPNPFAKGSKVRDWLEGK